MSNENEGKFNQLLNEIKGKGILSAEQAVIENLRKKGLIKPTPISDTSDEELEFFMNRSKKEVVLENKDVWEWVAIFYGSLKELVELKELKESNPDGKEYAERKPLAWNAAKQAIELWKKCDYGALPSSQFTDTLKEKYSVEDMEKAVELMEARYKIAVKYDVTNEWRLGFEVCQDIFTDFIKNKK